MKKKKHRSYYYVMIGILAVMCLMACFHADPIATAALSARLQQAENVMNQRPDSALHLLEGIPVSTSVTPEQRATWALLLTQARHKLFMPQSDSLFRIAHDYFMRHGNARRKTAVLYYAGSFCKEQGEMDEALNYYLQAAEEVEKTEDYSLGYLVCYAIADTYAYRGVSESALGYARKAYRYARQGNDSAYICSSLAMSARIYSRSKEVGKAISCYKQALLVAEDCRQYKLLSGVLTELIGLYGTLRDVDSLSYYMDEFVGFRDKYHFEMDGSQYAVMGEAFRLMGRPDSARYYYQHGLQVPPARTNIYVKRGLYAGLHNLAFDEKDFRSAAIYGRKILVYNDSVSRIDKSKALLEIQAKYDQQKLVSKQNEWKNKVMQGILAGVVITLSLLIFFFYKLWQKEQRIRRTEGKLLSYSLTIQQNELTLGQNRKQIAELEAQIKAGIGLQDELKEQEKVVAEIRQYSKLLEQENRDLQNEIDSLSDKLKKRPKELEQLEMLSEEMQHLHEREWFLLSQLMQYNQTLCRLKDNPQLLNDKDWKEISRVMDTYLDNFTQRLTVVIPSITKNELQLCCLIKLHIPNFVIATLLGIEPNSVSKRKFRLKERLIQEFGHWKEGMTLDNWLHNF